MLDDMAAILTQTPGNTGETFASTLQNGIAFIVIIATQLRTVQKLCGNIGILEHDKEKFLGANPQKKIGELAFFINLIIVFQLYLSTPIELTWNNFSFTFWVFLTIFMVAEVALTVLKKCLYLTSNNFTGFGSIRGLTYSASAQKYRQEKIASGETPDDLVLISSMPGKNRDVYESSGLAAVEVAFFVSMLLARVGFTETVLVIAVLVSN